jgi:hypothetical protein
MASVEPIRVDFTVSYDHVPGVSPEPESGTHPVAQAAETKRVRRDVLENASQARLDGLVCSIGLVRGGVDARVLSYGEPFVTARIDGRLESDDALRSRAIAYAEEWGLLEEDEPKRASLPEAFYDAAASYFRVSREPPKDDAPREESYARYARASLGGLCALSLHAGGKSRLALHDTGTVIVDGHVAGPWPELPRMLDELRGTAWDITTTRVEDALVFAGCGHVWDLVFLDDGGLCARDTRDGVPFGEEIIPAEAADQFRCIIVERHTEMRAEKLGRALFETEPAVRDFVDKVADSWCRARSTFDASRHLAAFDKAWDRDELGFRTACLVRARQIIAREADRV